PKNPDFVSGHLWTKMLSKTPDTSINNAGILEIIEYGTYTEQDYVQICIECCLFLTILHFRTKRKKPFS
ncbi:hypothetical protein AVEN_200462-1, partial [Araneus ventricosus]